MKAIYLKPKKEAAILRFHPWVFSGAVNRMEGNPIDGDTVAVCSHDGRHLATGHYQNGNICVRIFVFQPVWPDEAFWTEKIANARRYRITIGLPDAGKTNCFRLIHAEGDGLPGLIIDWYAGVAVVQCHSIGMHLERSHFVNALRNVFGDDLKAIYDKSRETLPADYAAGVVNGYLSGGPGQNIVLENGYQFHVDWETGQKTGFFLDQRENRRLMAQFSKGKKVLNAFCYSGGFSVYALGAGASHVDSVDVSAKAMEWTNRNVALNHFEPPAHQSIVADVIPWLNQTNNQYDLMVVDPPAFAKNIAKRHSAVQGYKRLNALALKNIIRGGILFTFSCSQVIDRGLFNNTVVAAALEAGRHIRVMQELGQPADHPVNLFHPEGSYLKGLMLQVE